MIDIAEYIETNKPNKISEAWKCWIHW